MKLENQVRVPHSKDLEGVVRELRVDPTAGLAVAPN